MPDALGLLFQYISWIAILILYFALYLWVVKICTVWKLSLAAVAKATCVFIVLIPLSSLVFSFFVTANEEDGFLQLFIRYVIPFAITFVMFAVLKGFSSYEQSASEIYTQEDDGAKIIQPERHLSQKESLKDLSKSSHIANVFLVILSSLSSISSLLAIEIIPPETIRCFAQMDLMSAVVSAIFIHQRSREIKRMAI